MSLAKEDHAPVQDYVFHDSCVSSMCFANIDNEPAIVSGCFSGQIAVRSTHSVSLVADFARGHTCYYPLLLFLAGF